MASDSSPSKIAVVGWANLPPELLSIISGNLQNANDIIRFRSVCRSWRSSSTPPLPEKFHTFFPETYTPLTFPTTYSVYATDVYLLRPRRNPSKSFLVSIQVQQPELVGKPLTVRHLLTNESIIGVKSWPSDDWTSATRIIRSYGYDRSCHFCGRDAAEPMKLAFTLKFTLKKSGSINHRLVGLCQSKEYRGSALTAFNLPPTGLEGSDISKANSYYLYRAHLRDAKYDCNWPKMVDFVKFRGEIYTVDVDGMLYKFDPKNSDLTQLTFSEHRNCLEEKRLLVSDGELHMIARKPTSENPVECFKMVPDPLLRSGVLFKWDEVKDLGERVFFITRVCSFSMSVKDLPPPWRGNTVVICNRQFDWPVVMCKLSNCRWLRPECRVYELGGGGRCGPIELFQGYSDLFAPGLL